MTNKFTGNIKSNTASSSAGQTKRTQGATSQLFRYCMALRSGLSATYLLSACGRRCGRPRSSWGRRCPRAGHRNLRHEDGAHKAPSHFFASDAHAEVVERHGASRLECRNVEELHLRVILVCLNEVQPIGRPRSFYILGQLWGRLLHQAIDRRQRLAGCHI